MLRWLTLAVPLALYVQAWRLTRRARRSLSAYGEARYVRLLGLGPHAGRRYFTEAGWAIQAQARALTFAGWATAVAWLVAFGR